MMEPDDRHAAEAPRLAQAQEQAFSYRKVNKSKRDAHHQVYIDAVLLGHVWQEPTRVIGADGIPMKKLEPRWYAMAAAGRRVEGRAMGGTRATQGFALRREAAAALSAY